MPVVWLLYNRYELATEEIPDDSRHWIERADPETFRNHQNDRAAIQAAKDRNWKILPGTTFYHEVTKIDGVEHHFRSTKELIDICYRHALLPD